MENMIELPPPEDQHDEALQGELIVPEKRPLKSLNLTLVESVIALLL